MLDDHGAGDLAAGVSHQVFEEREFFGGEVDAAAGAFGAVFDTVEMEIFHHQHGLRWQVAAAQQGADAG